MNDIWSSCPAMSSVGPTNRSRPKSDFIFQFGRKLSKYQTEYQNSCILKQRFINKWNYRSVLHKRGDESSLEKGVKDIPKCQVRKPCHLFLGISPHTYAASFSSATTTTTLPPSYSSESSPTHSPSSSWSSSSQRRYGSKYQPLQMWKLSSVHQPLPAPNNMDSDQRKNTLERAVWCVYFICTVFWKWLTGQVGVWIPEGIWVFCMCIDQGVVCTCIELSIFTAILVAKYLDEKAFLWNKGRMKMICCWNLVIMNTGCIFLSC